MVGVHGLLEEVVGAVLHGLHGLVDGAVGGHHDDGHFRVGGARGAQHVHAGAVRHAQVGEDEAEGGAGDLGGGLARVGRLGHAVAGVLQRQAQHAPEAVLVLDEKDVRHNGKESGVRSQESEGRLESFTSDF